MGSKEQKAKPGIQFKKLFFPFLILVVVVIISLKLTELQDIFALFAQAKWPFLVLALLSQMVNIAMQTNVYGSIMKHLKFAKIKFSKLYQMVVTAVFLDFSIPSLGVAGKVWLYKKLTAKGYNKGKTLLMVLWESACYYLALIAITLYSLVYIYFKLGSVGYAQKVGAVVFVLLIVLLIVFFYYFFKSKKKAEKRIRWFNSKLKVFNWNEDSNEAKQLLKDFYGDFHWLKSHKSKFIKPVTYQILKFIVDGITISLIFLAFGYTPTTHLALGLVAFTFGRLLGIVTMIPGGIGAFEGAMILLLGSFGVPVSLALTVTLVYRFFSYWLYFPFGLLFAKDWKTKEFLSSFMPNGKKHEEDKA